LREITKKQFEELLKEATHDWDYLMSQKKTMMMACSIHGVPTITICAEEDDSFVPLFVYVNSGIADMLRDEHGVRPTREGGASTH
jgi:hypothetical protein